MQQRCRCSVACVCWRRGLGINSCICTRQMARSVVGIILAGHDEARQKLGREPESKNLRAWLRTYRDLISVVSDGRSDFMEILSDYLVAVPGIPIVERWFGQLKLTELKLRAHKLGVKSEADSLRVMFQDILGRRPAGDVLNATRLLCNSLPAAASRGGHAVVLPASKFAVACQGVYREFFGEQTMPGRALAPITPAQAAAQRHQNSKPHLGRVPVRGTGTTTVSEHLRRHRIRRCSRGVGASLWRAGRPLGKDR